MARQKQGQFRVLPWREGAKGPLRSRWWAGRVQTAWHWQEGEEPGKPLWLLVEWPQGEPEPTKYDLCDLPQELSRKRLVQLARGGAGASNLIISRGRKS